MNYSKKINRGIYVTLTALFFILIFLSVLNNRNKEIAVDHEIEDFQVFPQGQVIEVRVNLKEEDLEDIFLNPLNEEYKISNVIYDGVRIDNVGFRVKGNSSLMFVAVNDSNKYSFKLDFDLYSANQTLFGIKKLNLNNSFMDPTYMREYLSYDILKEMGLPVPRTVYINLYINDKLHGLYLGVEAVDEVFLERNFDNPKGDLYKPEGPGSDLLWKGKNFNNYSGMNPKTNIGYNDEDALLNMINELNNGHDYESVLNVENILKYFAVTTVIANLDSYQGPMTHNYYLYEEDGVFSIIPWDYNSAFIGFPIMISVDDSIALRIDQPTMVPMEKRPLISKLLNVPEYRNKYYQYVQEVTYNLLSPEVFNRKIEEISNLIRAYAKIDPTSDYSYEEFELSIHGDVQGIVGLQKFVDGRRESIMKQFDNIKQGQIMTSEKPGSERKSIQGKPDNAIDINLFLSDIIKILNRVDSEFSKGEEIDYIKLPEGMHQKILEMSNESGSGVFEGVPEGASIFFENGIFKTVFKILDLLKEGKVPTVLVAAILQSSLLTPVINTVVLLVLLIIILIWIFRARKPIY